MSNIKWHQDEEIEIFSTRGKSTKQIIFQPKTHATWAEELVTDLRRINSTHKQFIKKIVLKQTRMKTN